MKSANYKIARGKRIRSYKITIEEHDKLLELQNYVCAICGKTDANKALAIDHNHESGGVRGLLCSRCNRAIGLLRDNADLLRKAAEYLDNDVPEWLQGKLIQKCGVKIRVPLDYEPQKINVEASFAELVELLRQQQSACG